MQLKPQTILIVDDNEDDCEALVRAFKKIGLDNPVSMRQSGSAALEFLKQAEKPALILLDLNMPGMDGHKVLQMIKEDASLRHIPVIIWSTSSNEKDVETCYRMGANAYMQKPIVYETLLESAKNFKEYWFETARLPA